MSLILYVREKGTRHLPRIATEADLGEALVGQTVWVVERGLYENRGIVGIYATLEGAIAANPPRTILSGGWMESESSPGTWTNGLDWDEAAECYSMVIR